MPEEKSPMEKIRGGIWKWVSGTIAAVTTLVGFVILMRANYQLALLIVSVLVVANLLLLLLYVIFHTQPASARSKQKIHPYEKYRQPAAIGILLLVGMVALALSDPFIQQGARQALAGTFTVTASPTAPATATPTPLPPQTTLLVTVNADHACAVDAMGVFNDVKRRDALDVGINNNSDRDLMIVSATLKPLWVTASQWMGPIPLTAKYDVSLQDWWLQAYAPRKGIVSAQTGWLTWVKPAPLEIAQLPGDKFTVKKNSQDRFKLVLGLPQNYEFMWGTLALEIKTDDGQTLASEPLSFAVCYERAAEFEPPAAPPEPLKLNPAANRAHLKWYAWNEVLKRDSGGVRVEIPRVVIAENSSALDFETEFPGATTAGEIFFKIHNTTAIKQLILARLLEIKINRPQEYQFTMTSPGVGSTLSGYLEPGETWLGSYRFETADFAPADIHSLQFSFGCAFNEFVGCSGPALDFDLDLPAPAQDPLPAELVNLLSQ